MATLDVSPSNLLSSLRGQVVGARRAHPDVLHIDVRDSHGAIWRLATQDSEWSPSDPAKLVGRSVQDAAIDEQSWVLRCSFADGTTLEIKPSEKESGSDLPYWELLSPAGAILEFGPGLRWHFTAPSVEASR
jgi:hypothetical protein